MYPAHAGWSVTEYMLADLIDIEAIAVWQRTNAGLEKGKSPTTKPAPFPRPGAKSRRASGLTDEQILAFKQRQEARAREMEVSSNGD